MKQIGVVIDYNGYEGIIETEAKDEYILLREEVVSNDVLKKLDKVSFVPDNKRYEDGECNIARFVRKISPNASYNKNHFKQI